MDDIEFRAFLDESVDLWQSDPLIFYDEVLDFQPDTWQEESARDLAKHQRVAIKSGQGVGKTAFEAASALWFLTCFDHSRVVATAPTKQQLHDVLWSEISKWQSGSPLLCQLLNWSKTYVRMTYDGDRWFAVARTASKPENLAGFHEDNMLFIVDEASGVSDPIMETIQGTLSGINNKLLLCSNPTKTSGVFYDAFTADRGLYVCHTVSSRESKRTNKDNIASLDRKYGKESNVVRVRVDGEFPQQEDDVFIQLSWVEGSIRTEPQDATAKALGVYYDSKGNRIVDHSGIETIDIGCDVARFGDDKTVIGYKVNEVAKVYKKYNGQDTTWTAGNILQLYKVLTATYGFKNQKNHPEEKKKYVYVKIDDGGVGGGVTDQLRAAQRKHPKVYENMVIVPIHFGQPIRHKYYYDSTTLMMGVIREMIQPFDDDGKPRDATLILPDDVDLVGQLSTRKYGFIGSKLKVESKKEMKDRGLQSPDEADCMLLTCYPVKRKGR